MISFSGPFFDLSLPPPTLHKHQKMSTPTILTLLPYVTQTRRFGHTYVHANIRNAIDGWHGVTGTLDGQAVVATFCGWGRSLQTPKGHKYKAHLRFVATGKPVPTKLIASILS